MSISVIIPVYNVESYLEACVSSILEQTHQPAEIILVDDGSTDSSGMLCDQLARKHKSIKVIHQENKGLSAARNTGMRLATGTYVSLVDSDDILHPQMYELLLEAMKVTGMKMAFCGFARFSNDESIEPESYELHKSDIQIVPAIEELRKITKIPYYTTVWRGLYERSQIKDIPFEEGMIFEDVIWSCQVRGTQDQVAHIPYILYYYRQHESSIIHQPFDLKKFDRFKALGLTIDYLSVRAPELVTSLKVDAYTHVMNSQFQIWDIKDKKERREYQELVNLYKKKFHIPLPELLACKNAKLSRKMFVLLSKVSYIGACWVKKVVVR